MRISGTGAGEQAGHRLRTNYFPFPTPEVGEKTKLGGQLRREEQLLSRTGMCSDRDGTVDDLSEGGVRLASPPRSGTTGVAQEQRQVRLDEHKLTSPVDQRPHRGWSTPRIVENSGILHSILN
jgi:hypothetical protein